MEVRTLPNGRWELLRDLKWLVWEGRGRWRYICHSEAGSTHDLSSIPPIPGARILLDPSHKAREAGAIHDRLYQTGEISRQRADVCWREIAMAGDSHLSWLRAHIGYLALRAGGWHAWRKYRRSEQS